MQGAMRAVIRAIMQASSAMVAGAILAVLFSCAQPDPKAPRPDQSAARRPLGLCPGARLPALPLRTQGRFIVDARGRRFKLASVNWYGAEQMDFVPAGLERACLHDIAHAVRTMGFNSVRLLWSNELVRRNPVVSEAVVAANPAQRGQRALMVLDAVIDALTREGLVVILANHVSRADWPWGEKDGNGLWYRNGYPESDWIADWQGMARRYRTRPGVVGVDLRNEPRPVLDAACSQCSACPCTGCTCRVPTWGGPDPALDWRRAAERGGNAVLATRPDLLVVVEGIAYASDLGGAYTRPLHLRVANRLVYSAHDYHWFHRPTSYEGLKTELGSRWGFLIVQGKPYTAPVWVAELGTCHDRPDCLDERSWPGQWFAHIRRYLAEGDLDWGYWALNGTQARGTTRTFGAVETFGLLDRLWRAPASPSVLATLRPLMRATHGP